MNLRAWALERLGCSDRSAAGDNGGAGPRLPAEWWIPYTAEEPVAGTFRARQLQAVLRLAPLTMVANALTVFLLVLLYSGATSMAFLIPWSLLIAASVVRGVQSRWRMRGRPVKRSASRRAIRWSTLHASVLSALWSAGVLVLLPVGDGPQQLMLIAAMTGMICAGGFCLATVPVAGTVFVLILGSGTVASLFIARFALAWYGTLMLVVYCATVIASVWSTARGFGARLMAEAEAEHQTELVGLLLRDFEENASDALWEVDQRGHLCRVSPRLATLFGSDAATLTGSSLLELLRARTADVEGAPRELEAIERQFASGLPLRDVPLAVQIEGQACWWSLTAKPLKDADGQPVGWRGVAADVTEAHRANRKLRWLAHFDPLTGVANRHQLRSDMAGLLNAVSPADRTFAVLCLDLDHFKLINDTLGHAVGDGLLREVAKRLGSLTRCGDTVARLGGDEFAIVLRGIASSEEAELLTQRIVDGLALPSEVLGTRLVARASIGVSLAPRDGSDIDSLLNHADLALYAAKAAGRGRYRVFTGEMATVTRRRLRIEQALRGALDRGEMWLAFQPQVDIGAWRVTGFEALLRWSHPELGEVSPVEFIPVAEDTGEIQALGAWVLDRACREAARWPSSLTVSVNVSPVQAITHDLCTIAQAALRESGLAANRLELEITESIFMKESTTTMAILLSLREAGMRIALDDFGTGYSSLAYLRRFPFDTLKVDRSFVREIGQRRDLRAIVKMIIGLAQTLGMRTVAEGVETDAQASVLRRYGCQEIQGFLVARPMPASKVAGFLDDWGDQPALQGREPVQTGLLPLSGQTQ